MKYIVEKSVESKFYKGHIKGNRYTFSSSNEIEQTDDFKNAIKLFKKWMNSKKYKSVSVDEIKSYDPETKCTNSGYKISALHNGGISGTQLAHNGSGVTLKTIDGISVLVYKLQTFVYGSSINTVTYGGFYLKNNTIYMQRILSFLVS